jgi:LmbE family N-acetylglucosaminyl deacetylase
MALLPVDLLVFAPHPDDETVGTGGVIQQAVAAGKKVRVVFVTNGDGYPQAAAALLNKPLSELAPPDFVGLAATRQREAVSATSLLGLSAASLVFLGYPDAAMPAVNESHAPVESPYTARHSTYGPAYADYHVATHGQPAAYARSSALGDVVEILHDSAPGQIYVTDPADTHPDHVATFELVSEAAVKIGHTRDLLTFVVHSGPGTCWPWPQGATPHDAFDHHKIDGITYPIGAGWPPPVRVPLTAAECQRKLRALNAHASQYAVDRIYLESFVKSEEVFWRPR